jgi:cell wall-associated NlpC family hydrolase
MRRLLLTLIVILALIGTVCIPVLAYANSELADVQQKLKEVQQEKKSSQKKISDTKNQINTIQKEVQASNTILNDLNNHLDDASNQLQSLQSNIQKEEAELMQSAQDLQDADYRVKMRNKILANKLQIIYQEGNVNILDVLMQSTSFPDFLNRWQYLSQMIGFEKDMLERNKEDKELIVQKETSLQQELEKVQENYNSIQQNQKTLLAQKDKNIVKIASYSKKKQDLKNATQSAEENLLELAGWEEALLEQEKELKALSESSSALVAHSSLQKLIHPLLGIPYVWGGTTTKGFDCSGFTQYVFTEYGIHLPRTSAEQSHAGTSVSKDNLRTGDLVFFNTYGSPGTVTHVAIYIGNGEIVNAVSPVVEINRLDDHYFGPRYLTARRILTNEQYKAIIQ